MSPGGLNVKHQVAIILNDLDKVGCNAEHFSLSTKYDLIKLSCTMSMLFYVPAVVMSSYKNMTGS